MTGRRITRNQANNNEYLRYEIDQYNPFQPNRQLPRDDPEDYSSAHSTNSEKSIISEADITIQARTENLAHHNSSDEEGDLNNMATPQGNVPINLQSNQLVSIKDAVRVVPDFDGKNVPFSQFSEGCSEALEMIDPNAEANLTKLIRGKITGEARQAIVGQRFNTIAELKNFFKTIYAPAKSVNQLLGELGSEYQRENESVIAFANRMREIGSRIIEAKRLTATVDDAFRQSVETNIVDCFKKGLIADIEQRMATADNVNDIVKNAILIERDMAARKELRRINNELSSGKLQQKKNVFTCQICRQPGHEAPNCCRIINKIDIMCQFCKQPGHSMDTCFKKAQGSSRSNVNCRICQKTGHIARECTQQCQICGKPGHTAMQCFQNKSQNYNTIICQICNKPGHSANTCYMFNNSRQVNQGPFESRNRLTCQLCQRTGHIAASCRDRQNRAECRYCKKIGHTIEVCRSRMYSERAKAGNGQGPPTRSAVGDQKQIEPRSVNTIEMDNLLGELLPLN